MTNQPTNHHRTLRNKGHETTSYAALMCSDCGQGHKAEFDLNSAETIRDAVHAGSICRKCHSTAIIIIGELTVTD